MRHKLQFKTFAAGVLCALCSLGATAQEIFNVRDSWTPSGLQAGWHWGLEKGVFSEHGITVNHEDGNGSTTTVQLISTGRFDIGYTDLSVMAIARGKGAPIVSIGGLIKKTSLGVFVPKDSGIKTPKDLEGKEVIYTATSFEGPFIDTFLQAGGTSREKVNMVSVESASKVSTYVNGRGAAMITSVPFGTPYVQGIRPSDTIAFSDYGLVLPSYGLVVREETLEKRKEGLEKLATAFFAAWQAIIDGGEAAIEEAADIMIKRRPDANLDRDQTIESIKAHIPYFKTAATEQMPLGIQAEEDWVETIRSLESAKLIPAGSKPSDYFTNELLDRP